jgi:type II secretory pathway predicted ATPase ExeA/DNA-binding XRE family transcriptional regulator
MEKAAIVLKKLIIDCDINQMDIAEAVGISRPSINLCVNKGYIPITRLTFKADVERFLSHPNLYATVQRWLTNHNMSMSDIWNPYGDNLHWIHPVGTVHRAHAFRKSNPAMAAGDPDLITMNWEVEMINQEAMKHHKIFRQPFANDVQKEQDIYLSEDHRYIKEAMLESARNKGLAAIIGEVGSGKSTIRKSVIEQLKRDGNMRVIYPRIIDKKKITAATMLDAIIMDISDEKPKVKHEHKARQVIKLLIDRIGIGVDCVLIIEEAHKLTIGALQDLKQFWELEDGFNRLLGIILIGQPELEGLLDESAHPDLRELIRRIQIVKIGGLNGDLRDYLNHKFKRVGASTEKIITDDAILALSRRLTFAARDGKSKVSHAYPLLVNNWVTRAINLAHEMGETQVTVDVVEAL